jgi:hypothetical protein
MIDKKNKINAIVHFLYILKLTGNGDQIFYFVQLLSVIYVALAKVLDSALQTENELKNNEIREYRRNTHNIPKIITGPHAASTKATCCVPNGVGVRR